MRIVLGYHFATQIDGITGQDGLRDDKVGDLKPAAARFSVDLPHPEGVEWPSPFPGMHWAKPSGSAS